VKQNGNDGSTRHDDGVASTLTDLLSWCVAVLAIANVWFVDVLEHTICQIPNTTRGPPALEQVLKANHIQRAAAAFNLELMRKRQSA
jgi:hypothetical protein